MNESQMKQRIREHKEYYGHERDEDARMEVNQRCGRHTPGPGCSKAGSEYCDWECPYDPTDD